MKTTKIIKNKKVVMKELLTTMYENGLSGFTRLVKA